MNWKSEIDNDVANEEVEKKFEAVWQQKKIEIFKLLKDDFKKYFIENGATIESDTQAIYHGRKMSLNLENVGLIFGISSQSVPQYYSEIVLDSTGKKDTYGIIVQMNDNFPCNLDIEEKIIRLKNSQITIGLYKKQYTGSFDIPKDLIKYNNFYDALLNGLA